VPRQPLDMLAAAAPGHSACGRDGHEPQRSVAELAYRRGERTGQRAPHVAAAPLLVGEQARPGGSGVVGSHRDRGKPWWSRVGTMRPRSDDRLPTLHADGPTGSGTAGAPAGEGQIGQDGEHATTVPPSPGRR
jgi:hypothetical protein